MARSRLTEFHVHRALGGLIILITALKLEGLLILILGVVLQLLVVVYRRSCGSEDIVVFNVVEFIVFMRRFLLIYAMSLLDYVVMTCLDGGLF